MLERNKHNSLGIVELVKNTLNLITSCYGKEGILLYVLTTSDLIIEVLTSLFMGNTATVAGTTFTVPHLHRYSDTNFLLMKMLTLMYVFTIVVLVVIFKLHTTVQASSSCGSYISNQ